MDLFKKTPDRRRALPRGLDKKKIFPAKNSYVWPRGENTFPLAIQKNNIILSLSRVYYKNKRGRERERERTCDRPLLEIEKTARVF